MLIPKAYNSICYVSGKDNQLLQRLLTGLTPGELQELSNALSEDNQNDLGKVTLHLISFGRNYNSNKYMSQHMDFGTYRICAKAWD